MSDSIVWQKRWLMLAVSAMGLSALLALLLVLTRTPGVQDYLGIKSWFHSVLVLHVNFAVLVWLLSMINVIWLRHGWFVGHRLNSLFFSLALLGAGLMLISPFLSSATPVLSNYVPVLNSAWFFAGLAGFGLAVTGLGITVLMKSPFGLAHWAVWIWLGALVILLVHGLRLTQVEGWLFFEAWFWGAGHVLQFVYVVLLWMVWCWPTSPWHVSLRLLIVALLSSGLAIAWFWHPLTEESRLGFSYLMQWGMPLLILPLMLWWFKQPKTSLHVSVHASMGLMTLGLLLGWLIRDDSVMVTAHYHATNAAITVAFMGLAYRLTQELGWGQVKHKFQRAQIVFYSLAMGLYVMGMAVSGWLGVSRKTAQIIDQGWEQWAMSIMGVGGALSILASLFFAGLMVSLWTKKRGAHEV